MRVAGNPPLVSLYLADDQGTRQRARRMRDGGDMSSRGKPAQSAHGQSTQSEMTEIVLPNDTNTLGNLLGGQLMHFIDLTGAMAAYRHARTNVVTAAMDHIDFIRPVHLGDLVTLKSSVNRAFTSSMEVGVKVWAENTRTGDVSHVASAYLVFVAVDEHGRPQKFRSCSRRHRTRCGALTTLCAGASIASGRASRRKEGKD